MRGRSKRARPDMSAFLEGIGLTGSRGQGRDSESPPTAREQGSRKPVQGPMQYKAGDQVRVWWEPTTDKSRSGFSGAYWPAVILERERSRVKVQYDNGDDEWAQLDHISPDNLPLEFGEEKTPLEVGEFCEVHNGSKSDPCAWLCKVMKVHGGGEAYTVEYPFHDSKPERFPENRVRRARVWENGKWKVIKPHQTWPDGDVASPMELETIDERNLANALREEDSEEEEVPDAGEYDDESDADLVTDDDDDMPRGKRSNAVPARPPSSRKRKPSKRVQPTDSEEQDDEEEQAESEEEEEEEEQEAPSSSRRGKAAQKKTPARTPASASRGGKASTSASGKKGSAKKQAEEEEEEEEEEDVEEEKEEEEEQPKKRGRTKAKAAPARSKTPVSDVEEQPKKRRGRPPKKAKSPKSSDADEEPTPKRSKGKGRPSKAPVEDNVMNVVRYVVEQAGPNGMRVYMEVPKDGPVPPQAIQMILKKPIPAAPDGSKYPSVADAAAAAGERLADEDEEDEDEAARARKGSKKDPNVPKPPKSAFMVFSERYKAQAQAAAEMVASAMPPGPDGRKPQADAEAVLRQMWKTAPAQEKQSCESESLKDVQRYEAQCAAYVAPPGFAAPLTADQYFDQAEKPARTRSAFNFFMQHHRDYQQNPQNVPAPYGWEKRLPLGSLGDLWKAMSEDDKAKYEQQAAEDKKRHERELGEWKQRCAERRSTSSQSALPSAEIDKALNAGVNAVRKAKKQLGAAGFSSQAYATLLDAWRKDSPRVSDAIRAFQQHVEGKANPKWGNFFNALLGEEQATALRAQTPQKAAGGEEGPENKVQEAVGAPAADVSATANATTAVESSAAAQ